MSDIRTIEALEALYDAPSEASLTKVTPALTPAYQAWIEHSRFCILSTAGPKGVQASPRGDDGPVVRVTDPATLMIPDWRGNNRLDCLRNIVSDGRAALMFFVSGSTNVIRVNGQARLNAAPDLCASFARKGVAPRSVIIFAISEVYFQCARALIRSRLWSPENESAGLPSAGDILSEITQGGFDGASYDAQWAARAEKTMW
ncbi:MAG: pyridoxamine 5'-phosphate oxidase family protein [Rhodobacteraceae bacterium]|nr:MAG: pyridoxamine 5'-phosphate oxidase family protein [Paracoccaceae bacterium]